MDNVDPTEPWPPHGKARMISRGNLLAGSTQGSGDDYFAALPLDIPSNRVGVSNAAEMAQRTLERAGVIGTSSESGTKLVFNHAESLFRKLLDEAAAGSPCARVDGDEDAGLVIVVANVGGPDGGTGAPSTRPPSYSSNNNPSGSEAMQ